MSFHTSFSYRNCCHSVIKNFQLHICRVFLFPATTVQSPEGTVLMDNMTNTLLDDAPLSPELLNTVDPSAVTQSFKYPVSCTDPVTTR